MKKDGKNDYFILKTIANKKNATIIISIITTIITFILIYSAVLPEKYALVEGEKSYYDIVAPRDSVNIQKATDEATVAASNVQPVTTLINDVVFQSLDTLDKFFTIIEADTQRPLNALNDKGIPTTDKNYNKFLDEEKNLAADDTIAQFATLNVTINKDEALQLLNPTNTVIVSKLKNDLRDIVKETTQDEINDTNIAAKILKIQNDFKQIDRSELLKTLGEKILANVIKPNRKLDEGLTLFAQNQKRQEVYDSVIKAETIKKGERIINKDEVVTKDKLDRLAELNLLSTSSNYDFFLILGTLIISVTMTCILLFLMFELKRRKSLVEINEYLLMCLVLVFTMFITIVVYKYKDITLFSPVVIAPMLVGVLLGTKKSIAINFALAFAVVFITKGDVEIISMVLVTGSVSAYISSRIKHRNILPLIGVISGVSNVIIILGIGFINQLKFDVILLNVLYVFANGIISSVIAIGLLPFLEIMFGILTPIKLQELGNPNQPLLKRLLMEAPGTYHHSLMVGNMAEVAALEIDGDPILTRVGAIYHDIGKLNMPYMYRENQVAGNPHDKMSPNLSTMVIIGHPIDGCVLAEKHKIPKKIRDIILQHHGNTLVSYFYGKALEQNDIDEVLEENFRYNNPRPQSKEAALVMLADSTEAAVRSLPDKSEIKIGETVKKIVKGKLNDGQLDLCDLTLKDLDICVNCFMRVLNGVYHTREVYPDFKKIKNKEKIVLKESTEIYNIIKEKIDYSESED